MGVDLPGQSNRNRSGGCPAEEYCKENGERCYKAQGEHEIKQIINGENGRR
jgi:hypothetical protein